jgi:hypothetical protein
MLSLYFNCKIVSTSLNKEKVGNGCFYPVCYPSDRHTDDRLESFEVLLETLKSLSNLSFDFTVFNIDLSESDSHHESVVRDLIEKLFCKSDIFLSFKRPNVLSEWKIDVKELINKVGEKTPVLVMFNHDHPYIDYCEDVFSEVLENVFSEEEGEKKLLHFTHISDMLSEHYHDKKSNFNKVTNIVENTRDEVYIHNTSVMTAPTLLGIWESMRYSNDYIGRIDWFDVTLEKSKFTHYVFGREFFGHYDGYTNVTGNRLTKIMDINAIGIKPLPADNYDQLVDFYYTKFIDTYSCFIQRGLLSKRYDQTIRDRYIELVEKSLHLLKVSYLQMDFKYGIILISDVDKLLNMIREKIYFNGNLIFTNMYIDNLLKQENPIKLFKIKVRKYIPDIVVVSVRKLMAKLKEIF